jgi:hypothetical protein
MCVILILWPLLFVRPVERALPIEIPPDEYPDCDKHEPYWYMLSIEREAQWREAKRVEKGKGRKR